MATWREKIGNALKFHDESWDDVVHMVAEPNKYYGTEPADGQSWLDVVFDDGFGGAEGHYFTVWTANRVYFPTEYDGAEGVGSVPRNPCDEATRHQE